MDFDSADNCQLYCTTMKAMNIQNDFLSIASANFKDHCVLVFVLTSMQDANKNCQCPELVGEKRKLIITISVSLEHVTDNILLREIMSSGATDKFSVVGENVRNEKLGSPAINHKNPKTQISVPWFFLL